MDGNVTFWIMSEYNGFDFFFITLWINNVMGYKINV